MWRDIVVCEGIEECRSERARGAVATGAVDRSLEPDVLLREEPEIAVEPLRVAAGGDDIMAVDVLRVEAQRHPVERLEHDARWAVHHPRRWRVQARASPVQMGASDLRHVGAHCRWGSSRRRRATLVRHTTT